jgi:PAS domain S-box-containing protein
MKNLTSISNSNRTLQGTVFGLLFPIFGTLLEAYRVHGNMDLNTLLLVQSDTLLLWLIDSAPFVLGIAGYLVGLRETQVSQYIEQQEQQKQLNQDIDQLYEQTGVGMIVSHVSTTILKCNQATATILGYTPEELIGKSVVDVLLPESCHPALAEGLQQPTNDQAGGLTGPASQQVELDTKVQVAVEVQPIITTEPVFDSVALSERLGGDKDLSVEILGHFISELDGQFMHFSEPELMQDAVAVADLLHLIKGVAANVGTMALSELTSGLERQVKQTQTSLTAAEVAQLEVKYAETKLLVQAYIES